MFTNVRALPVSAKQNHWGHTLMSDRVPLNDISAPSFPGPRQLIFLQYNHLCLHLSSLVILMSSLVHRPWYKSISFRLVTYKHAPPMPTCLWACPCKGKWTLSFLPYNSPPDKSQSGEKEEWRTANLCFCTSFQQSWIAGGTLPGLHTGDWSPQRPYACHAEQELNPSLGSRAGQASIRVAADSTHPLRRTCMCLVIPHVCLHMCCTVGHFL